MNAHSYKEFHCLVELGNPDLALVTTYHAEDKPLR